MMEIKEFTVQTPKHELIIQSSSEIVSRNVFDVQKKLFACMCKDGCSNFGVKYCCPPFSPSFDDYQSEFSDFLVVMYSVKLDQLNGFGYSDYQKLQIGNAVIKPRLEKYMREVETNTHTKFFSTGACRLCKPCLGKLKKPCKYHDKRRFSLESVGVNCNKLALDVFGRPLLWYKDKTAPQYTSVIAAVPLRKVL